MSSESKSLGKSRPGWIVGLLAVLALVIAACGAATEAPAVVPTEAPAAAPTEAPAPVPTDVPPAAAPLPTEVPGAEADILPSVTVTNQAIVDSQVIISQVVSDGPGWLVVHAQADGKPGPILGYSPVSDGENVNVMVQIDVASATETQYAMLHTDAGEIGTWEFPNGPDAPVQVDGQVVTPAFAVTGGLAAPPAPSVIPSVTVADQALAGSTVTIAQVVSDGPGWLVVHARADGKPGPVVGYSAVNEGTNRDVAVQIDLSAATTTLYAMLHTDAGTLGAWEFPNGPDVPVQVNGQVVTPAFNLQVLSGEGEVEIEDFQFRPKTLVVRVGTTVKWANKDQAQHTATSDTGVWDSGYLAKGDRFTYTFTQPGVFPYYCIPHGAPGGVGMAGTIIVLP
jgi:plastocyanin